MRYVKAAWTWTLDWIIGPVVAFILCVLIVVVIETYNILTLSYFRKKKDHQKKSCSQKVS